MKNIGLWAFLVANFTAIAQPKAQGTLIKISESFAHAL